MTLTVKVEMDNVPDDSLVYVNGIGNLRNHSTTVIEWEDVEGAVSAFNLPYNDGDVITVPSVVEPQPGTDVLDIRTFVESDGDVLYGDAKPTFESEAPAKAAPKTTPVVQPVVQPTVNGNEV